MQQLDLKNFEDVKERIHCRLQAGERESKTVSLPFLNLKKEYWIDLGNFEEKSVYGAITEDLWKDWGIGKEQLDAVARENLGRRSPCRIQTLEGIIKDLAEVDLEWPEEGTEVLVVTNERVRYGAAAILEPGVCRTLQQRVGNYYILPSSVHEVLIIPESKGVSIEDLQEMVQSVNDMDFLQTEDYLSDEVYTWNPEEERLECVTSIETDLVHTGKIPQETTGWKHQVKQLEVAGLEQEGDLER